MFDRLSGWFSSWYRRSRFLIVCPGDLVVVTSNTTAVDVMLTINNLEQQQQ